MAGHGDPSPGDPVPGGRTALARPAPAGPAPEGPAPEGPAPEGRAPEDYAATPWEPPPPVVRLPCDLRFTWAGIAFAARIEPAGPGGRLSLRADVCPLPYSAEDAEGRSALLALLDLRPAGGAFAVAPGQRLEFHGTAELPPVATSALMLGHVVRFVLEVKPYLVAARSLWRTGGRGRAAATEAPA